MTLAETLASALHAWSPELAERLNTLAFLGSAHSIQWVVHSECSSDLQLLCHAKSHDIAVEMWRRVLRENFTLATPALIVVLEHIRRNPANTGIALAGINLDFSKTLANVSFRAADSLYESAKTSFANDEIDVAIARFKSALSEFRFAIESQLLSDSTRRIATGKYATAVAMIGRWSTVSQEAASRARSYSQESMTLGNIQPETFIYRLELLVQHFDQTGDVQILHEALEMLSSCRQFAEGSELAEAEVRVRLASRSVPQSRDARRYLATASRLIADYEPKNKVEEARRSVLLVLAAEATEKGLSFLPNRVAIPRGLLSLMATKPTSELWSTVRRAICELDTLQVSQDSIPAAVLSTRFLRQIVEGPAELLEHNDAPRYAEITRKLALRSPWNRHAQWEAGAAALSAAKRTRNWELARKAQEMFKELADQHPTWPLPHIGIARAEDFLGQENDSEPASTSLGWLNAASLALNSPMYARSSLGGRSEVFAVADARGLLSETFVFKRTTRDNALHEKTMLTALRKDVSRLGITNRFVVPRSLAIVEVPSGDERRWVHVTQRAAGRLVSELRPEEASSVLNETVDLLVIFHRVAGDPSVGKSAWKSLKEHLKMWSRTLFEPEKANNFVDALRQSFPSELPLVRKRDGHASNWLLDPAGRIVAVDFESSDFVPVGYDVAQLVEDNSLIPANSEGWKLRMALMARYLNGLGRTPTESLLSTSYGWLALTRALRLGTEKEAGKQLRRHAREICAMLFECGDEGIKPVARELLQALSRVGVESPTESVPTHDHRRLSKAMAYQLRHGGPTNGIPIDKAGYAAIDDLGKVCAIQFLRCQQRRVKQISLFVQRYRLLFADCAFPAGFRGLSAAFQAHVAASRRTCPSSAINFLRAIHKLLSVNSVLSCAVFFFKPR